MNAHQRRVSLRAFRRAGPRGGREYWNPAGVVVPAAGALPLINSALLNHLHRPRHEEVIVPLLTLELMPAADLDAFGAMVDNAARHFLDQMATPVLIADGSR